MILLLALLAQDALKKGDAWAFERTYRYVNEAEGIDMGDVERTDVSVADVRPDGYDLAISRKLIVTKLGENRSPAPADQTPWTKTLKFGANGQPNGLPEDVQRPIRARIDRMLWTASENRRGLGWNRTWPLNETLPEGKATVKPSGEGRLSITYTEAGGLKAEGTATRDRKRPVIVEMSATINRTYLPGGNVPVAVAVKQLPAVG